MKTKKILTVILSLCMLLSVVSVSALTVSAEEELSGGWEFSDISASNITADEQAILDKALEGMGGVDYDAKDVIAKQVVAGTNYAFLCISTPTTLDPQPYWSVVTVYADLGGNASLTNIARIDPANVAVKDNISEQNDGGWTSTEKENVASLPEDVQNALNENDGVSLSPIAVLGTQVVAGTNYRILAYGTLVVAEPVTNLYEVTVFDGLGSGAEITSVEVFDIEAYVTPKQEYEDIDDDNNITGGWEFSDISADSVTEEERAVFDKAMAELDGVDYEPKDVIATQVVAGTNYAFLCIAKTVVPGASSRWTVVTIFKDLGGNAEIVHISDIDPADVKTLEEIPEIASGSWNSTPKEEAAPIPENIKEVLDRNLGLGLSSIAVLGTQIVAGTNYRILAYGVLATQYSRTDLYVVDVYENPDGEAEITSIAPFDLLAYISDPVEEDEDNNEEDINNEEEEENNDPAPVNNDDNGNNHNVPETGSSDTAVLAAALMLLAGITITAHTIRKKQR